MGHRRLTDSDIETLIAGEPLAGAPTKITTLVAALRNYAEALPDVPVAGALKEFIVDGTHPRPLPAEVESVSSAKRSKSWFAKVAAAIGAVPAQLLLGTTVTVAAVGGVYVLNVVDGPALPNPRPPVETPAPTETIPAVPAHPGKGVPATDHSTGTSPSNPPDRTLPDPANGNGTTACEHGRDATSETPSQGTPCDHGPPAGVGRHTPSPAPSQPEHAQGRTRSSD